MTAAAPSATAPATNPPIADPTTVFIITAPSIRFAGPPVHLSTCLIHQGSCHEFRAKNALIRGRLETSGGYRPCAGGHLCRHGVCERPENSCSVRIV